MSEAGSPADETAGVVARPPLIFVGYLAVAFILQYFQPWRFIGDTLNDDGRLGFGAALAGLGIATILIAALQFRRAGTNVQTSQPTTAIVTQGLYAYSRNPIYVAQTLVYLGITIMGDNLWALLLLPAALMMIRYGVIAREEAYLERRFGLAYVEYKARVRRWI
jgi:protein-S-isoprenylcysteine O-methyltransferase Ste14